MNVGAYPPTKVCGEKEHEVANNGHNRCQTVKLDIISKDN